MYIVVQWLSCRRYGELNQGTWFESPYGYCSFIFLDNTISFTVPDV